MSTILDKIVARKNEEIATAKSTIALRELEQMPGFKRQCLKLKDFMLDPKRTGIIAEFKRQSPSKGIINGTAKVEDVVRAYDQAGASAISVLTDLDFFGGRAEDLMAARVAVNIPLLRKDFMLDEYQLFEAKAWGADIILLIAAILTPQQTADLAAAARSLGLNVLLEVHNAAELERSPLEHIHAIGVNNRNLADFSVNLQTSFDLVTKMPAGVLKVSESAISAPETIKQLKAAGFNGFLVGENFMKTNDPGKAIKDFVLNL